MFFGNHERSRARRRGVVLILILGMLALMALIGVTFATFAGQSLVNTRNFAAGVNWPGSEQLMDYALAQLINDTNNPLSAIRGHSLLRDMYGNDSVMATGRFDQFRVNNTTQSTGSGAATRGLLTALPDGTPLMFLSVASYSVPDTTKPFNFAGYLQYQTNIPVAGVPSLYGVDFTRWIVRVRVSPVTAGNAVVPATYEVVEDNTTGATHVLTLAPVESTDSTGTVVTRIYNNPNVQETTAGTSSKGLVTMVQPLISNPSGTPPTVYPFVLDGRYMRAFNGSGMSAFNFAGFDSTLTNPSTGYSGAGQPNNNAAFGNFRTNGGLLPLAFGGFSAASPPATGSATNPLPTSTSLGDPSAFGMDEDYDACDLENWFLALQSADGSVMIPSFHRPGILTANDWTNAFAANTTANAAQNATAVMSVSKILRPRSIDNYPPSFPPDPIPNANGQITYDIDNDGDGITDSVWLDLGYPPLRDQRGQTFKPLFAFMVIGLNGRLPLNTAGNLQSRDFQRPIAGAPSVFAEYYPQNYTDGATWNHASHLGYSVNEVNPMYALQNAPNLVYGGTTAGVLSNYSQFDSSGYNPTNFTGGIGDYNTNGPLGNTYNRILGNVVLYNYSTSPPTAVANAGVGVDIIQHRNLLAGTVAPGTTGASNDANSVTVAGSAVALPNSMMDSRDTIASSVVSRSGGIMAPGRWGEANAVPTVLDIGVTSKTTNTNQVTSVYPVYTNAIRAGKSAAFLTNGIFTTGGDGMDDDGDCYDFFPFFTVSAASASIGEGLPPNITPPSPYPATVENTGDAYDAAGSLVLPVERIRRFVTPIDPSGNGRVVSWADGPPINAYDYGSGFDRWGRAMFFRYFRPAGMPKAVAYDPTSANTFWAAYKPNQTGSELSTQIVDAQFYNQPITSGPVLNTSQPTATVPPPPLPVWITTTPTQAIPFYDLTSNIYHGWQSFAAPIDLIATTGNTGSEYGIPVAAPMPYDWSYNGGTPGYPLGYANTPIGASTNDYPVINNNSTGGTGAYNPSTMTPLVNSGQGPVLTVQPNLPGTTNADTINYLQVPGATGVTNTGLNPSLFTGSAAQYPSVVGGYPTYPAARTVGGNVMAMPSDGLNKNEADEMNLYAPNSFDMPYGPADLEWLYRLHDVDGAQLSSRLQYLAPISFTNPADGLTRRRLFSTDSWETISASYAPDNPYPVSYDYVNSGFTDPSINYYNTTYNSRFNAIFSGTNVSASLSAINYLPPGQGPLNGYQNPQAIQQYPNPLSYPFSQFGSVPTTPANSTFGVITYPYTPPAATQLAPQQAPSLGSRDRKVNLNYPLPVSNDPAEPVRQKWIRETYQYFKSILPPQSIDTPQELAQLSQFVVNIIDFRDPDCSNTRFVNTDLIMIPASQTGVSQLAFADRPVPFSGVASTNKQFIHYPFDPTIYDEQMRLYLPQAGNPMSTNAATSGAALQSDWQGAMTYPVGATFAAGPPPNVVEFLVQHGVEFNPLAINEVMAYQYMVSPAQFSGTPPPGGTASFTRLAFEVLNMLSDDGTVKATTNSSSDMTSDRLDGWDIVVTDDSTGYGRPDPVTGELPMPGLQAASAYPQTAATTSQQMILTAPATSVNAPAAQPVNAVTQITGATTTGPGQYTSSVNALRNGPQNNTGKAYYLFNFSTPGVTVEEYTSTPPPTGSPAGTQPTFTSYSFPGIDATLPATFAMPLTNVPAPGPGTALKNTAGSNTMWCWLFLRRPANPFDRRPYTYREMVTVDAIRFPYTYSVGSGTVVANGLDTVTSDTSNTIYSIQRLQPFRGGHLVPPLPGTTNTFPLSPPPVGGAAPPYDPTAWGYSEQTAISPIPGATANTVSAYFGDNFPGSSALPANTTATPIVQNINLHTFGAANTSVDTPWDYFAFNDRDFMSPAELLLVPGCPPGLLTKQFVEDNNPFNTNSTTGGNLAPGNVAAATSGLTRRTANATAYTAGTPHAYPYLVDKFYYSAAQVVPPPSSPPGTLPTGWTYPNLVGGWTGDGWYKMLEFVEVPSSANGSIGNVAVGDNFDWLRQDLKPGLLNLNLIIDEEVFFGLLDDPRLNDALNTLYPGGASPLSSTRLPQIVTQINAAGSPTSTYPISSVQTNNPLFAQSAGANPYPQGRGYTYWDATGTEQHGIKAAFSDFLKLRAGGSGFLFAWGSGTTGSGPYDVTMANMVNQLYTAPLPFVVPQPGLGFAVARERPYRSLSAPDINDTILRPAPPPPSLLTNPPATYGPASLTTNAAGSAVGQPYSFAAYAANGTLYGDPAPYAPSGGPVPTALTPPPNYVGDQGIRNPFLAAPSLWTTGPANYAKFHPILPMRRLFQIPDANTTTGNSASGGSDFTVTQYQAALAGGTNYPYKVNQPIYLENLYYPLPLPTSATVTGMTSNLFAQAHSVIQPGAGVYPGTPANVTHYLGSGSPSNTPGATDNRQHPYFRTEMLQKVMNLTTVRTHQFAVWITIGFFEVLKPGSPSLGQPDVLGGEIGLAGGRNTRYRSFFLLDRTRATGFDPSEPGDFRDVVTYRRRIE